MASSKFNVDNSDTGKLNRTYKGVLYASIMEMKYFRDVIEPKMESGEIIKCEKQVLYILLPSFVYKNKKYEEIQYRSDFNVYYADGHVEVIDIKGLAKPLDVAKRKLLLYTYPDIDFKWLVYSGIDGGWREYDYVKKQRAKRKKEKVRNEQGN